MSSGDKKIEIWIFLFLKYSNSSTSFIAMTFPSAGLKINSGFFLIFLLGFLKNHRINTKIIREKICKIDFRVDESSNRN